jgi:carbonic anhydrase/acetyltransferase-like protein (isoleucine patch superfamily)
MSLPADFNSATLLYLNPELQAYSNILTIEQARQYFINYGSTNSNLMYTISNLPNGFDGRIFIADNKDGLHISDLNNTIKLAMSNDGYTSYDLDVFAQYLPTAYKDLRLIGSNIFSFKDLDFQITDCNLIAGDDIKISINKTDFVYTNVKTVDKDTNTFTVSNYNRLPLTNPDSAYVLVGHKIYDFERLARTNWARNNRSSNPVYGDFSNRFYGLDPDFNVDLYKLLYPDSRIKTSEECILDYTSRRNNNDIRIGKSAEIVSSISYIYTRILNLSVSCNCKLEKNLILGDYWVNGITSNTLRNSTEASDTLLITERGSKAYIDDKLFGTLVLNNVIVNSNATFCNTVSMLSNLNVSGVTTLSNKLYTYDISSFSNDVNVFTNMYIGSNVSLSNDLTTGGNIFVGNSLNVGSNMMLSNNLTVGNSIDVLNTTTTQNLNVGSNASVSNDFLVHGLSLFGDDVVANSNFTLSNDLLVKNNATICNNLFVANNTTISNNIDIHGDAQLFKGIEVIGTANFLSNVTLADQVDVYGAVTISNNLSIQNDCFVQSVLTTCNINVLETANFNGDANFCGSMLVHCNLDVLSMINIGTSDTIGNLVLDAKGSIRCDEYLLTSDVRVKTDVNVINTDRCFDIVKDAPIISYSLIYDPKKRKRYGFLANEIERLDNTIVSTLVDYIPNIMKKVKVKNQKIMLKKHSISVGDQIKLAYGTKTDTVGVIHTTPNSIKLDTNKYDGEAIYAYGKEIKDFKTIDYAQLFAISMGALQKVINKVESLEKDVQMLRNQ